MPQDRGSVAIVGAGLAGALLACSLGKRGYRVDMYEQRGDMRRAAVGRGRSINLAISTRGLHALGEVGLAEEVLRQAVPMRGRMIHGQDGSLAFQPYSKDPKDAINSVSRAGLNKLLLDAAERHPNVRLHFGHKCVDADLEAAAVELHHADTGAATRATADFIIATDGAYSAVRARMQRQERFDYSQHYLEHGYKELTILPGPDGRRRMEPNALHIWPRHSFMMIALPNCDGSFTCTLFWPFEGANSFAALRTERDVLDYFGRVFPDVVPLIPTLAEDYLSNPTGSMVTIRCGPWYVRERIVLLGDAAHAVVPFYGQGANAAFEDCTVLAECLDRYPADRGRAFVEYYRRRRENTDALADLAVGNFIEMRDKTASRAFRLRKKIEKLLHKLLPGWYTPLYHMVTFTLTPYAEAVRRAQAQDRAVLAAAGVVVVALLAALVWAL